MSYDLFFTSPQISIEEFNQYFSANESYEVSNGQAWYNNDDTGVYFVFEHNDSPAEEGSIPHSISFSLNYYRPHVFALEAEPEIRKLIDHFGCTISDYQNEGMGEEGPYSTEGFIRGWNKGNEFGYSAILKQSGPNQVVHTRPSKELEAIWEWNYNRDAINAKINEDIFIPRIFFMLINGELSSIAVWPDAISTLVPQTDYVYIPRRKLAPKKWFRKTEEDFCIIPKSIYVEALREYETNAMALPAFKLPAPDTPEPIKDFVRKLRPFEGTKEGIALDSVLNTELAEKSR